MSVGNPLTKSVIDSRLAFLTVTTRDTLEDWVIFKAQMDSLQDSDLTGLGYSSGDVTVIRGLATAMAKLRNVAHGQDTQSPASDYFFNSSKVTALD